MGTLFSLSKSATSIALDTSEIVLLLFGILLTVGLIGEYAKSERWKKHVKTFEMLVIIGVAGELLADGGIFLFSSHLQTIADQEIADLTVTAGNAKASAETAAKAADRAKASADAGKQKADAAGLAADKAKEKVEAVTTRAEQIDAGLAQTQFLLSARSLENRDELANKLKERFKGKTLVLTSYIGDQEGWGLCTQLLYVAKSAEMNPVDECEKSGPTVPLVSPLSISGPDLQETMDIADALVKIGRIPFGTVSAIKGPIFTIFVGVKPSFMIGQARGVKVPTKKQAKEKNTKP
jgi:hypothetical protein